VEGQHIITSKNDKADARCVHASDGYTGAPLTGTEPEERKERPRITRPSFYIQPMVGIGGYIANNYSLERLLYMNGELRFGITSKYFNDYLYVILSGDIGFNASARDYPSLSNIVIGPEYFFFDNISCFVGLGLGILTQRVQAPITTTTILTMDTSTGFGWKLGFNWLTFTWGETKNYSVPISFSYSGVKTSIYPASHVLLVSVGFRFLQRSQEK
jgi:hypothetical protein